jgi:mRNA-degrading endonuclease toxin of MazEF toxin-antitoxin module
VIVSDPQVTEDQRFPILCVVPITSTPGRGALYPALEAASGGLRRRSFVLLDQVRTIDKRRVSRVFGTIAAGELEAIDEGLCLFLGWA